MTRIPPILVITFFGAIAAFCVLRVHFNAVLYEMLPQDLPEVQGMDRLNRYFSRDGQLIVTVKAKEAFEAEEAMNALAGHLTGHPELVAEVFRELTLTELVTEGGELLAWLWLNAPEEKLPPLGERLSSAGSKKEITAAMEAVQGGFFDQETVIRSYDPLGLSRLGGLLGDGASGPDPMSSGDGTFRVMYVEGKGVDFSDYRDAAKWLDQVKEIVAAWEREWKAGHADDGALIVGLTGTPAFMAEVGARMEFDMTLSVVSTMLLISLLFWWMHRQTKPLSWLISAMLVILSITLTIGGFLFGDLSVMSAGFAAILMGLAVDYGIVLYREAYDSGEDAKGLRRSVGPGILWAAATTAAVFLSLNLSSLPGLSEMGNLVAIGVGIGALVMLYGFAPVAVSFVRETANKPVVPLPVVRPSGARAALIAAVAVPILTLASMWLKEMPALEVNFHPFRIRESPSMVAWQTLQHELSGREKAVPTVITARDLGELHERLETAGERIARAEESGLLEEAMLPTIFIPDPVRQRANAPVVRAWLSEKERLLREIGEAGFSEEGAALTATAFSAWEHCLAQLDTAEYARPEGKLANWSVDRLFAEKDGVYAALATVKPVEPRDRTWVAAICDDNLVVASLGSLGTALNERIGGDLVRVFLPMLGILTLMLALVFRSWRDVVLNLFCLLFAASILILATTWTPMSWNSFNVCGLPLIFGTGLDYGIHMILALRRNGGEVALARTGIGRALLFCGGSSAIGFGSLALASAYGLASLGLVCAIGILANMVAAVWLLPHWYRWLHRIRL
ncbi:MAG: MMPL family transporter [Verrucomicrobiae bacterium]|nr:MMPL family transporter [Verrucomicrobiae bacterium]